MHCHIVFFLVFSQLSVAQLFGQNVAQEPTFKPHDYVTVTAPTGYLLDSQGEIKAELPCWSYLRIDKIRDRKLLVTGQNGETGWIRRELIHLHPWNNPTDEQLTAMKRSAKLLTQSAKQIDDELLREALASAQAALATVEQTRKSHELAAWVRC